MENNWYLYRFYDINKKNMKIAMLRCKFEKIPILQHDVAKFKWRKIVENLTNIINDDEYFKFLNEIKREHNFNKKKSVNTS